MAGMAALERTVADGRPASAAPLARRHLRAVSLALVAVALLYLGAVLAAGWSEVALALGRIDPWHWLGLLALSLVNYACRFARWQHYLARLGHEVPWRASLGYYLAGLALTVTPGKAGETIRSLYLRRHGVSVPHSLAAFVTERFLDLVVIALLASTALLALEVPAGFVLAAALAVVMGLLTLRTRRLAGLLALASQRLPGRRPREVAGHAAALLAAARELLAPASLAIGLGLGLVAWSAQGVAFIAILAALGFEVPAAQAMGVYAVSLLAGALSFVPGGIGTTEGVMALLLAGLGAGPAVMVAAPLVSRLTTLWFAVCLGLVAAAGLGLRRG
jgi:glycosyltransferase 2 family protein